MNKKKIGIIAGVTLAVTGLSVGGGFAIAHAVQKQSATTTLLLEAKAKSHHDTISATSASIYCAFAKKIAPLALKLNGKTDSLAFSVVDAFVSYSMEVYLSNDNVQASYCQTLGAKSMDEINQAVFEISSYLGTSADYSYQDGLDEITGRFGAANINSLWLDPDLELQDKIDTLLQGLQEYYFADVYHAKPTQAALQSWLKKVAPTGFDRLPELQVPEDSNASCVSSYFLQDHFLPAQEGYLKEEYQSRNHYLDYTLLDGSKKSVDYIATSYRDGGMVYFGDGYASTSTEISKSYLTYYLPDEGTSPFDLIDKVFMNLGQETHGLYRLNVKAPYFLIKTDLNLTSTLTNLGLSELFETSLEKLVKAPEEHVTSIKQDSLLSYDYNGFYAASATVVSNAGAAMPPELKDYNFVVNRPHLFTTSFLGLPVFYGVVNDPGYAPYGA